MIKLAYISIYDGSVHEYFITCENGKTERYTPDNVPDTIIRLLNYNRPFTSFVKGNDETIVYLF